MPTGHYDRAKARAAMRKRHADAAAAKQAQPNEPIRIGARIDRIEEDVRELISAVRDLKERLAEIIQAISK